MYSFDAKDAVEKTCEWIKDFFLKNGNGCNAIVGISGGKDSSVVAALLVKALGKDRVYGVLMPNDKQDDIDYSYGIVEFLGIKYYVCNIKNAFDGLMNEAKKDLDISNQSIINLPPRLRMSTLYLYSQSLNGRVANTCNLSEDYVGYSTRYGDSVGDFSPLSHFTVTEVLQMAKELGLPSKYYEKAPSDGLSGQTDEDKLGFTYKELDLYIREGIKPCEEKLQRIEYLHRINQFKLELMPSFDYKGENK